MYHMRFGLSGCGGGGESLASHELATFARRAEDLGFSALWLNEEHFQRPVNGSGRLCLSPLILAATLAAHTTRIRIGFSVLLLSLHHPLRLAEEIATLDVLSAGRIDFGISRGGNKRYSEAFGLGTPEATDFQKTLSFVLQSWTDDHAETDDKNISVQPRPIQRPYPPVYIGTYSEDMVRWAAASGFHLIQHGIQSLEHIRHLLNVFDAAGGQVESVPVGRFVYVSESDESARQELKPVIGKLTAHLRQVGIVTKTLSEAELQPERFYEEMVIAGSPATCVIKIARLQAMRIRYLNCLTAFFGYLPDELLQNSLTLLAKEVMPHFPSKALHDNVAES